MTNEQREEIISKMIEKAYNIRQTKGREYAVNEDINSAFNDNKDIGISPEQAIGIFAGKHWNSIRSYIKEGQVHSEPISERIADMINYLLILDSIIVEKNEKLPKTVEENIG